MHRTSYAIACSVLLFLLTAGEASFSQSRQHPLGRHIEFVKINSKALAGNLIGDPSTREMAVMLPPSYFSEPRRRFPVVYLLHGLGPRKDGHLSMLTVLVDMFNAMKSKELMEIMLVAVDGTTSFGGSYFANSVAIGNFEEYVVGGIVSLTDIKFRTVAMREGRGIAGFSMGGHGAVKLAMKYSRVFSQVGSLSGSPMSIRYRKTIYRNAILNHKKPSSMKQLLDEITFEKNWNLAAAYAKGAAFSPNPSKPPFYFELPFEATSKDEDDPVWQLWWDDDPLGLVSRFARNLRTLEMIYLDQGDDETTLGTEDFVRELVRYGIGHHHFIFRGDHTDRMSPRYLRMLKYFSVAWARP